MLAYPHTFEPFAHQASELNDHWDTPGRAIFWEQGLGKMKAGYDWAMTLWQAGHIDTLIVVAPNGVHRDWIEEGFKPLEECDMDDPYDRPLVPPMWHDQINRFFYQTKRANTQWHRQVCRDALNHKGMAVISISYDGAKTKGGYHKTNNPKGWVGGKRFLTRILRDRRCAIILDESANIQNPSSLITKTLVGHGRHPGLCAMANWVRVMDGTPVDEGPFNVYPQMQALRKDFWHPHGMRTFQAYKSHFGIFRDLDIGRARPIAQCVGYRNLEQLHDILQDHSTRLLKSEALDLPPKQHVPIRFDMSPEQWRIYNELEENLMVEAKAEGRDVESLITAELPITNVLKLYQITCGYLPFTEDEDGEPVDRMIEFKENPRLETALQWLKTKNEKTVIWCRFTRDIELLIDALGPKNAVRYDGKIDDDEKAANKRAWLKGDPQFLVPQIQAMYSGHNLNIAPWVLYYSNDSRLRLRRQSEDRTHRGKMNFSVLYGDMMASDTVDEKRVKSLRKKKQTSDVILGDSE